MDITDFSTKIEVLATQYNEKLQSLQLEPLTTHEYGEQWNKEQHSLLGNIGEVIAAFMKQGNYNSIEHNQQLVTTAQNIIAANNITFTVQSAYS
jgi:hypothetical protein